MASQPPPPTGEPWQPPPPQPNQLSPKAQAKAEKAYAKSLRPWYKKKRFIIPAVIVALLVIGNLAGGGDESPTVAEPATTTTPSATPDDTTTSPETVETTAPPVEETPVESGPVPAFGEGTFEVGTDIQPGDYRSDGATSLCYWERLSGFDGELASIITNGNLAPEIVTVAAGDAGFTSQGCGDWYLLDETLPDAPATSFTDGTYAVGGHIEAGTYSADGSADDICYYARLSSFSGGLDAIIANGNSPTIIEIAASDAGFTTNGCGTWTKR